MRVIKRLIDIIGSAIGIMVFLPIMAVTAGMIYLSMGGPVLFRQMRPGLHGKPFYVMKFRTMTNEVDEQGVLLLDAQRQTAAGRLIRKTSLDELPQLFNVLRGELSLVGPRPLLMEYLPLYSAEQARRHSVKPGITGWAQVNGRNTVDWERRFSLDVWYVDNWSLWLDIKILVMTVSKVLKREGINQEGSATMEKFRGNHE